MTNATDKKIICIKLGGSIITDKEIPYKAQEGVIRMIAKTLKKVKAPLLIGHGSGSFGHTSAQIYGGKNGYTSKWGIAKVARDAQEINRIVMDIFIDEGLPAIAFSPRSFLHTKNGEVESGFYRPVEEAMQQGLIPVVYGDVIWDSTQKTTVLSGESILNILCRELLNKNYAVTKIIQLCNVDGVMDDTHNVVPEINEHNWASIKNHIKQLSVADVTGGMLHKVEDALAMTNYGVETLLLNGHSVHKLHYAIGGQAVEGTVIK